MPAEDWKPSRLVELLVDQRAWLMEKGFVIDDVLVEDLPSPETVIGGNKVVSFSSNNYLGLSRRPEVLAAAQEALNRYGIGTCESRRLGGNLDLLEGLERALAEFKGTEAAILFATGLMTNVGAIPAIVDAGFYVNLYFARGIAVESAVILGDWLNHYSIRMGIKQSRAESERYRHNDMGHLEQLLEKHRGRPTLIVTDGVFSMDGDMAPLREIVDLARFYRAAVYVDDAHGTGVYGQSGKGSVEHLGIKDGVDFQMGTLSKAFGALGGFVGADEECVAMLKLSAATYYFTSSLPAEQAAGLMAAVEIIKKEPELRKRLWRNVFRMLEGLRDLQVDFSLRCSQIIPIMVGDDRKALEMERFMLGRGVQCSGVTPPAVTSGKSRLRCMINATHTDEHIDAFLNALEDARDKFGLERRAVPNQEWEEFRGGLAGYIKDFLVE